MPHPVPLPGSARARLIDAGLAHFGDQGYEHASVTAIAADAGVTTGSLYHHFGSKLGLYRVIREEMERRMTERMEGAIAAVGGGRDAVRAALEVAFDAAVRFGVARILAEPPPDDAVDPIAELLGAQLHATPLAARLLVAAWRSALMAVAEGAHTEAARQGLVWVLTPPAQNVS